MSEYDIPPDDSIETERHQRAMTNNAKSDTPATDALYTGFAEVLEKTLPASEINPLVGFRQIIKFIERSKEHARAQERELTTLSQQLATVTRERDELQEALNDKRRLTRELDIAMCGEQNAAKHASLCDLIPIARRLKEGYATLQREFEMQETRYRVEAFDAGIQDSVIERRLVALIRELMAGKPQENIDYVEQQIKEILK